LRFAAAISMIALAYTLSGRYMGNSALLFLAFPIAALVFNFATCSPPSSPLRDSAITWRGTKYSLEELKKKR
jgi:hypothetical protein